MSTGAARQRILGDLKGLQKEKWVRIDVSLVPLGCYDLCTLLTVQIGR